MAASSLPRELFAAPKPKIRAALSAGLLTVVVPTAQGEGPVRSLSEIRREHVVIQQWDTSCGAAAVATVLTFAFGDPVSEKAVAQAMLQKTDPLRVRIRGGFSLLDLKRFAEGRGYSAVGYRGLGLAELLDLKSAIVPIDEFGNPHFVVVRGMREGELDIADPAFGNRRMAVDRFQQVWKDGIGFVITRAKL